MADTADQAQLPDYRGGLLNHVSLIYRPGERHSQNCSAQSAARCTIAASYTFTYRSFPATGI
jgi:hypothetical protein